MMNQQVRGGLVYNVSPGVEQLADNQYHVEVTYDKGQITADGVDQAIVKVRVLDYLGNLQNDGRVINFNADGQIIQVHLNAQGEATVPIKRLTAGVAHVGIDQAYGATRGGGVNIIAK